MYRCKNSEKVNDIKGQSMSGVRLPSGVLEKEKRTKYEKKGGLGMRLVGRMRVSA